METFRALKRLYSNTQNQGKANKRSASSLTVNAASRFLYKVS